MAEPSKILRGRIIRGRKSRPTDNDVAYNPGQIVVSVASPSSLGNPFKVSNNYPVGEVIRDYRIWLKGLFETAKITKRPDRVVLRLEHLRREHLAGKEIILLCYCRTDEPCHADVIREYLQKGEL